LFTGIVEEIGRVESLSQVDGGWTLCVAAVTVLEGTSPGDSIAVNGTCLTVTTRSPAGFCAGLSDETLRRTDLGDLAPGARVNLERSLASNGRVGGHFVQGHIDGTGVIRSFEPEGDSIWVTVETAPEILRYIVPKGYIAVDGVSLTVVDLLPRAFTFMLVPHTQKSIALPGKQVGSRVNLEVCILGKYVEKFLTETNHAARQD
jgi:riboflavin synthase